MGQHRVPAVEWLASQKLISVMPASSGPPTICGRQGACVEAGSFGADGIGNPPKVCPTLRMQGRVPRWAGSP